MKRIIKKFIPLLTITSLLFLNHFCIDPLYDLSKGIDPEISIGGDTLGIPLGKLDTIFLRDVLDSEEVDFLKIFEDGGYALNISDSIYIEDLLKNINVDDLDLSSDIASILTKINFQKVDFSSIKIPEFSDRIDVDLNFSDINLGEIDPGSINLNEPININFQRYSLAEIDPNIERKDFDPSHDQMLAPSLVDFPSGAHPEIGFNLPDPVVLDIDPIDLNYSIEVPNSVSKVDAIVLEHGAEIKIELFMENAQEALKSGKFTPNCTVHIHDNIFEFELDNFYPDPDKILLNQELNVYNNYKSTTYTRRIISLQNLPLAEDGSIDITNLITITGDVDAEGIINENKIDVARNINLRVNIQITDMVTDYLIFEIQNFESNINKSSEFNIVKENIPEDIASIDMLYFNSPNNSNESYITVNILPQNLPAIQNPIYKIDVFDIKFPEEFKISSPGNEIYKNSTHSICRVTDKNIDPINGYSVKVYIEEVDFSGKPIEFPLSSVTFDANIDYEGNILIAGTANTKDMLEDTDYAIQLNVSSELTIHSTTVTINDIRNSFDEHVLDLHHDINTEDENISYLSVVKVKPETYLIIDIIKPEMALTFMADDITLKFSDLYVFNDNRLTPDNHFIIRGEIPDQIKLEIKELHINKELVNGQISVTDQFIIDGSYFAQGGNSINSKDIEDLGDKEISFRATVPEMQIESVSVGMNSIEAEYTETIDVDFVINDFPKEIIALDSINFKSDAALELNIEISNLPDLGDSPLNAEIRVKIPETLKFASGILNQNNELVINQAFVNNHFTHSVPLAGFALGGSELNGQLSINEEIPFDVAIRIDNPTVNSEDLNDKDVSVEVQVLLNNLAIETIYGKFQLETDEQFESQTMSFDALPDFMKGDNIVLDILNPILALSTESNLGFPFSADLKLTKYIGGEVQTDDIISLSFNLAKSDTPNQTATSYVWYAPTNEGMPSEYTFVETPINKLLLPMPDSVKIDFKPTVDTGVQHVIDLRADYNVKVNYDMTIPMKFGKDLVIMFKDTLDDVKLEFEDIEINSGELEILATIVNSVPLNLSMQMVMLDEKDNIISTTESQTIKAGNKDGSGNTSNVSIRVAESFNALKGMDKIVLEFRASSDATIAGTPIKPDNFVTVELTAKIVGGIQIKLPLDNKK